MHRIRIRGSEGHALVQTLTPRRIDDLAPGRIRYALRIGAGGQVLGDLTIWRLDSSTFEVFAGTAEPFAYLKAAASATTSVCDLSRETAIFAVQGPSTLRALAGVTATAQLRTLPYFGHVLESVNGVACRIGRLGYTGERGFEIILPRDAAEPIWTKLAAHARPAGFAAADILRIEAGFPLFANEFLFPVSAAELGLTQFAANAIVRCKGPFPRRAAQIRLVSFRARCDREPILWRPAQGATFPPPPGELTPTSACRSIITNAVLGLGYVCDSHNCAQLVDASGQFQEIHEVSLPFYDPDKRRPRGGWDKDLWPADTGGPSFA